MRRVTIAMEGRLRIGVLKLSGCVLLVIVGYLGLALPGLLIDPGVGDFQGTQKRMAESAVLDLALHYDPDDIMSTEAPFLTTAWRLRSVTKCPGTPAGKEYQRLVYMTAGYRAEAKLYTLFGIPRGVVIIPCDTRPRWEPYF